ncbi:MAG TPA: hypothetical protein VES20_12615 [Bryobacteraceae bacterium]|nr:hypothetical protein [Bryobacteraceae bacterium]
MISPEQPGATRNRLLLLWLPTPFICIVIYWYGLRAGSQMDDFAWLGLHQLVHDFRTFLEAVFAPKAQGTIRPWSERLLFLGAWHFFGANAAPVRVIAFLTTFVSLALTAAIGHRLTGRGAVVLVAPVLWLANPNLYVPMAWSAAYNQILCSAFLLGAFFLWIRFCDTGRRRLYASQLAVFVLGLGALEINVVYPALAAVWAFCRDRRYLIFTLPLFAISAVYTLLHRAMAPPQRNEIYRMFFDLRLFHTLGTYLWWTVSSDRIAHGRRVLEWPFVVAGVVSAAAVIAALVWAVRRKPHVAIVAVGWFCITLAPVLPLRNHISDYYLTIPLIGLALLGSWAFVNAWESGRVVLRVAAVFALLCYALPGAWTGYVMSRDYYLISNRVRTFLGSVASAHRLFPDKGHVIRNMDSDLFWACWWDNPFRLFGLTRIWVDAGSEPGIAPFHEEGSLSRFFLPKRLALEGLRREDLVAWELLPDGRLRNVSTAYALTLQLQRLPLSGYLDLRTAASAAQLGDGWYEREPTHRWMSGRAVVHLRGPVSAPGELVLRGRAPQALTLAVEIAGRAFPPSRISTDNLSFELRYPVPAELTGQFSMPVTLSVDRTVRPHGSEQRDLGLAFGTVEVRP